MPDLEIGGDYDPESDRFEMWIRQEEDPLSLFLRWILDYLKRDPPENQEGDTEEPD